MAATDSILDKNKEAEDLQPTREGEVPDDEQTFNYDSILDHLGHLGRTQLGAFLWLCLPALFPGIAVMSYLFTGAIPDYRLNNNHAI